MSSINKPGLAKLNTQTKLGSASFKSSTASKLATTKLNSGISYGIMAQRSKVGTGAIFNVKRYNSESISAQRHALNDNRVVLRNNNFVAAPAAHNCSGSNAMNKYAAALAVTGMLAKTLGSLTAAKASGSTSAANTVSQNGAAGVINDLASAKNSADIQKGLDKVATEITNYETKIAKAEETIASETKLKTENETKLKDTETQISSEKQNITKMEGTITKLESSLQNDKMTLSSLKSQLSTSGDLGKMALETQIAELEAKIAQEEQQLTEAKNSKQQSENNIKNNLEPTKEQLTKDIATCDKNIQEAEAEKNSSTSKKEQLQEAQTKYTKKLSEAQNKESKELSKLRTELANYAKEFSETSDAGKKNKISEKYTEKAKEYNEMIRSSTVSGHTEVSIDLNNL